MSLAAIMLLSISSCGTNSAESTTAAVMSSENVSEVETESSKSAAEEKTISEREIKVLDYTDYKKQIYVYRDDVEISGVLYLPEGDGPFPVVFFAPGLGAGYSYLEDIAKRFAKNGIATVLFTFAGVSGADDLTVLTEAEDLKAVIGGVRTLPVIDSSNVFLFGHSFGGLVASYVGCNYPEEIKGMILLEPAYPLKNEISAVHPDLSTVPESEFSKRFIDDLYSFDIYGYMPSFKGNVIIFLGTAEGSGGYTWPSLYEKAQEQFPSAELVYVEGADHSFGSAGREDVKNVSLEFIQNNISSTDETTVITESHAADPEAVQMIVEKIVTDYGYYGSEADERIDSLLADLTAEDKIAGMKWTQIMDLWRSSETGETLNYDVLPDGLPDSDELCIVVLGFQLNPDGTMRDELVNRLNVALNSAEKYPNAYIVCTGGGTASDNDSVTEAGEMANWLEEYGVEEERIIVEDNSLTTAQNALYTYNILTSSYPSVRYLAIVSSDYHIATGELLFTAEAILMAQEPGEEKLKVISNASWDAPSGSLSAMFQAGALIELSGDAGTAFDIYYDNYDIHELPPLD